MREGVSVVISCCLFICDIKSALYVGILAGHVYSL